MFVRTYASSRLKRKSFYRKSELQMFLLISGVQALQSVLANNSETVGHKDLRLGQIVYILVFFITFRFLGFFHWTVPNIFFVA